MIYMWFTGINYYKLAVEKDRNCIFTTIRKPSFRKYYLRLSKFQQHRLSSKFEPTQLECNSRAYTIMSPSPNDANFKLASLGLSLTSCSTTDSASNLFKNTYY